MSTSPIVRKDEGTQTTPPPGTAPSPETTSATNHDVATQSPAPSLLHPERETDEVSGTSADYTSAPAGSGVEPPPKEIPLLGPVPDNFGPAYDYLGKVKELADEIKPGLYETYFEEQFTQGRTRIGLFSHGRPETIISSDDTAEGLFNDIGDLRHYFDSAKKYGPTVLLVEAINEAMIQAFGMAFNVNPCFFARHLLPKDDSYKWTDQLHRLGKKFEAWLISRNRAESQVSDTTHDGTTQSSDYDCFEGCVGSQRRGTTNLGVCSRISNLKTSSNCCET